MNLLGESRVASLLQWTLHVSPHTRYRSSLGGREGDREGGRESCSPPLEMKPVVQRLAVASDKRLDTAQMGRT